MTQLAMSLLTSIQLAGNTLKPAQIGLQVVGQNIANVDTPGYIRESGQFHARRPQTIGNLDAGHGRRSLWHHPGSQHLRRAAAAQANADASGTAVEPQTYQQLEGLLNELGDNGLGID